MEVTKQASKQRRRLLLAHWKQREEVKRAGEDYIPWATHMWKQGKALQLREPDIIALEDPDTKEIKLEQGMQKVMVDYMQWLWGTREKKKLQNNKAAAKGGNRRKNQPENK